MPIIQNALISQGFEESGINVVTNADKAGIIAAFEKLLSETREGDMVFIHFSGHGQQIQDDNGDEVDGLDEAMIPIDAKERYEEGVYEGENHFRDDEFAEILTNIRRKAGPNGSVLVVIDACHSGTGTRGDAVARGTDVAFTEPGYTSTVNNAQNEQFGLLLEDENLAPMMSFYGASAHQLNYEYKINDSTRIGSLSFAFAKAFSEADENTSYQGLFDRIKAHMATIAPRQSPQAEGNLDQLVLGGKLDGIPDYALVSEVYDGQNVMLNKGQIHGVYEGTVFTLYPIDTYDTTKTDPIAKGTVVYSDVNTCDVELDRELAKDDLRLAWFMISAYSYGNLSVNVKIDVSDKKLKDAIELEIAEYPLIKLVDDGFDLLLEEGNDFAVKRGNTVVLSMVEDLPIWEEEIPASVSENATLAKSVVDAILAYVQAEYLRNLEAEPENLKVDVEFIPVKGYIKQRNVFVEEKEIPLEEHIDEAGSMFYHKGDYFKMKFTNNGRKTLYITVLDIMPDNALGVILPKNRPPEEYRVKPGESYVCPAIKINPPYGTEMFKVIASEEPMDLKAVIKDEGSVQHRGGKNNPFQTLFSETFASDEETRGGESTDIPAGSVFVKSFVFEIRE
ncbi:MAG: hypothetical protein C0592_02480 [Marinilabiliales bacterium]|nr:MAG: hypothetical protein C0592_02480 [Marinilabiliales bacterium]